MANPYDKYRQPSADAPVSNPFYVPANPVVAARHRKQDARADEDQQMQRDSARREQARFDQQQREWNATHNPDGSPSDGGVMDPQTISFYAQQVLAGGQMPQIGQGKQAAMARQEIMKEVARQAGASGQTGADLARQIAHYKAGSKSIANLETQIGTISANEQTALANGQQFLDRSAELPGQTNFSPLNALSNTIQRAAGGTTISAMDAAYNTFVNEYAKVVSGSPSGAGTLSDSARHEAMDTIRGNASLAQKQAAFDQMKADMANRIAALHQGVNDAYKNLTEKPGYVVPATTSEMAIPAHKDGKGGVPLPPNWGAAGSNIGGPTSGTPGGGQSYSTPEDLALQERLTTAYRDHASLADLNQISVGMGRGPLSAEWAQAVTARDAGRPYGPGTPPESGITSALQGALGSSGGAAVGNYLNAGAFGIPELLSGKGGFDALRNSNPKSSFAGELAGGLTGTLLGGKALGAVAGKVANPTVASLLANPITADVGYGSTYGANTADDPLYGAVGGGLAALGGGYAGSKVGRALAGLRTPAGTPRLSPGHTAVMEGVSGTGVDNVIQTLEQADSLGIPATLADVSPEVNSLTGAAIRRSPTVAGQARDTLLPRGRGQYDRFVGAVERDLGPVENIPQRSEDLIQQARTAAGPLYDAAYAAPGAGAVLPTIEDLLARPSMTGALGSARRIAAEEGRDPTALGFDLNDAGDTVLTRVPSWQTIDYAKRGLDNVLEAYPRNPITGELILDTEGRAINGTRKELLGRVDPINQDYAAARAAYSDPASERDYLLAGQRAVNASPNQLSVDLSKMTPFQADQARLGFQSQLAENAGKLRYSTNPFESTLGTPAMEQRLATMYPDKPQSVAQLLAQAEMERNMAASSNRLIGNSMTAERQVADQAFDDNGWTAPLIQGAAETAITGAPVMTVSRALLKDKVGDIAKIGFGKRAQAKAADVADVALNPSPRETIAQILAMQEQQNALLAARAAAQARGGNVGRLTGSGVSSALIPFVLGGGQ